ncbi:response regulator transcription factor [uncultured Ferrovibrio sp.]|jgi:DNA-binding NarL/FixJ family response regulator|uniref:response regulator n=1 Tax=uncultured Ferrovibrio sp. TaxID=1576913 RepID=UPI0026020E16|nr:response regulator transcription factor [uncultured Ferrovibrio sp.]
MTGAGKAGTEPALTIIIADDHPLVREALGQALRQAMNGVVIVGAANLDEARAALDEHDSVDLLILDLDMPGMDGFVGLASVRASYPAVPVAIVSSTREPAVMRRAIEFGAAAFVPKSAALETIASALQSVLDGEVWLPPEMMGDDESSVPDDFARRVSELTPQQLRVLTLLSQGKLNKQIAHELSVGEATVKAHVTAILKKLGVRSRTQAVIAARHFSIDTV